MNCNKAFDTHINLFSKALHSQNVTSGILLIQKNEEKKKKKKRRKIPHSSDKNFSNKHALLLDWGSGKGEDDSK